MSDEEPIYLSVAKLDAILAEDWTAIRHLGFKFSWVRPAACAVGGLVFIIVTPLPNAAAVGLMGFFFMLLGGLVGGIWEWHTIRRRIHRSAIAIAHALEESPSVVITTGQKNHTRRIRHQKFELLCRWETAELFRSITEAEAGLHNLLEPPKNPPA